MAGSPHELNPYAPPVAGSEHRPLELAQPSYDIPADRGTRLIARIVDSLLVGLVTAPGFVAMIGLGEAVENPDSSQELLTALLLGATLAPALLLMSYQWYLVATTGQSLAKRWFKIRIVRMDGSVPGFLYGVLLRSWVTYALNLACNPIGLVDALMIFGEQSRCLHDQIAGTKVVKT